MERDHIVAVLERVKWRIRGAGGAAELLGMKPSTLESRMTKLGSNACELDRARSAKSFSIALT